MFEHFGARISTRNEKTKGDLEVPGKPKEKRVDNGVPPAKPAGGSTAQTPEPDKDVNASSSTSISATIENEMSNLKSYIDSRLDRFKSEVLNEVILKLDTSCSDLVQKSNNIEMSITQFSKRYDDLIGKVDSLTSEVAI